MKRKKDSVEDDETLQFTGQRVALVQLDISYLSFFGFQLQIAQKFACLVFPLIFWHLPVI